MLVAIALLAALVVAGLGAAGGVTPLGTADHTVVVHRGNEPTVIPRARPRPVAAGISKTLLAALSGVTEAPTDPPPVIVHDLQTVSVGSVASALPPARAPPG